MRLTIEYTAAINVDLGGSNIIALWGRDFLEKTLLLYDGPSGEITLAY